MLSSSLVERETTDQALGLAWRDRIGLLLALLIGVLLIAAFWVHLHVPLWTDEQWRAYHLSLGSGWWQALRSSPDGPLAAGWLLIEWLLSRTLGNTELILRLPMAASFVGLMAGLFVLSRRWLGLIAAWLLPLSLLLTSWIVDFATQLKPFTFEAMCTLWALVLWLRYDERPTAPWPERLALGLGLALCCLCSTPTIFVLAPLLALSAWRAGLPWRRPAAWLRRMAPLLLAGAVALLHLGLFILPQSRLSGTGYWEANFVPRDGLGAAARFVAAQLLSFFPELLTAADPQSYLSPAWVVVLTGFTLLVFGLGVLVAWRDRAGRAVVLALFGALALQLLAAYLRLWPFGNVRVNLFLAPLFWLLGGLGIQSPLRWLARDDRDRAGDRLVLRRACAVGGIALGCLVTLFTAGQARFYYEQQERVLYGGGIREMVAGVRLASTGQDGVVVVHPLAWKGWEYYMRFYEGYPSEIAARPPIAAARSITIDEAALAAGAMAEAVRSLGDAPQIWVMALQGTDGTQLDDQFNQLGAAGFSVTLESSVPFTGALWKVTPPAQP